VREGRFEFATRCILGARFLQAATETLLPIRIGNVVTARREAGICEFHFRLGPMFDFRGASDLAQAAIDLHSASGGSMGQQLAFRAELDPPLPTLPESSSGASWRRFSELAATDPSLPINDEARRSLFLRLGLPKHGSRAAKVARLRRSSTGVQTFGPVLLEGRDYDLTLVHYVPSLERKHTTLGEVPVDISLPSTNISLNTVTESLLGNYGTQEFMLTTTSASPAWEKLIIAPKAEQYTSQDGTAQINAFGISLPVRAAPSLWFRLRTRWLRFLGLWLALIVLGAAGIAEKNIRFLLDGTIQLASIVENWWLITAVVVAAGLASIIVADLRAGLRPR
jgi:hypothetical protein